MRRTLKVLACIFVYFTFLFIVRLDIPVIVKYNGTNLFNIKSKVDQEEEGLQIFRNIKN